MEKVKANNATMNIQRSSREVVGGSFIEIHIPEAQRGVSSLVLTYRQAEDLIAAIRKEMK
ncbi:hypothetical protein [Cronobacter phage vB_Cdu_VP8]|nr:hypothetical protein [Cronobacter phage vB_Cdu_VP8]